MQPPPFFRREKGGGCLFAGDHGGAAVSLQAAGGAAVCAGKDLARGKVRRQASFRFRKKFRMFPKNRYKTTENAL